MKYTLSFLVLLLVVSACAGQVLANPFLGNSQQEKPGLESAEERSGEQGSAGNPFVQPRQSTEEVEKKSAAPETFGPEPSSASAYQLLLRETVRLQRELRANMSGYARSMKQNPFGSAFWLFALAAFGYGVVHAIGPGHGKAVVCSYVLGREMSAWKAAALGAGTAFTHVSSAMLLVGLFTLIGLGMDKGSTDVVARPVQLFSYGLLLVIGVSMVVKAIRDWGRGDSHSGHSHDSKATRPGVLAVAAGLVPCPGAAIILVFSISLGLHVQGFAAMFFLALGMGVTTAGCALLASAVRSFFFSITVTSGKAVFVLKNAMGVAGGSLLASMAVLLLLSVV